ncbi:synaptobrevin-like protein YKT6 [Nematocida sp. LUAm3]|nr:synaptobrevin-like protein YKT6 [Nematocida sp. LUAm3]KAI5174910.1 synaptobrevin-like protein YKT6 [Nematocida sp. LUAm2]KAI5177492.1 synaptobrevin-like protein YKT6 [Nematocida sp. LUAm1]
MNTLFCVILFKKDEGRSIYIEEYKLNGFSYFKRSPAQEMLRFLSKRIAQNIDTKEPQDLVQKMDEGDSYKFFIKEKGEYIYVLSTLMEYPSNTLGILVEDISNKIRETSCEENFREKLEKQDRERKEKVSEYIRAQINEYQDYKQKDIMLQINNELGRVQEILSRTLESALGRGEKIDELITSADTLSFQTKSLYKLSKKQNRKCCGIM